jgi:MinD-like ATPase involved in chromosome partitioning or flagellar assembly
MTLSPDVEAVLDESLWSHQAQPPGLAGGALVDKSTARLAPAGYLPPLSVDSPELGWQRMAFRLGARHVHPGGRELRYREWHRQIRRPVDGPKVIAVFSPKGGVGKSTTASQLGHVLATVRGEQVAALDANPDSGNLVRRVSGRYSTFSASDLYQDAGRLERYSDLVPYTTQTSSGLSVIRSDPSVGRRLGPDAYQDILTLLSQFYSTIIIDLGTGIREPSFLALMRAADAVIAITGPGFDAVEVVIEGIDRLSRDFPAKIGAGTALINAVERGRGRAGMDRPADKLGTRMAQVQCVPRDRHLAAGGVVHWELLSGKTQDAYLDLAAAVVRTLPDDPAAHLHATAQKASSRST